MNHSSLMRYVHKKYIKKRQKNLQIIQKLPNYYLPYRGNDDQFLGTWKRIVENFSNIWPGSVA